jgi:glycosyltransferase involved in cell wall biosynthesis
MSDIHKLKLVVIGNLNYPQGSATTNRIQAYAKGIVKQGYRVLVICTGTPFKKKVNFKINGVFEGVDFAYTSGTQYRRLNFVSRNLLRYVGFFKGLSIINKIRQEQKSFAILEFSTNFIQELIIYGFAKINKIPIIREENEIPSIIINNISNPIKRAIDLKIRPKLYDGIIVISKFLEFFFSSKIRKDASSLYIPILVDFDRFTNKSKSIDSEYFAYCGYMGGGKDGVDILIRAFKKRISKLPHIKLYLIGDAPSEDMKKLRDLTKELGLSNSVVFTGKISREEIPDYLVNARALVLARPNSKQSEAGFPTKLGEYLATSNPVIVTNVGEIDDFLIDNESALIAKPDDVDSLSQKMFFVVENKDKAIKIGFEGRRIALKYFDYNKQSKKIIGFIDELVGKNRIDG